MAPTAEETLIPPSNTPPEESAMVGSDMPSTSPVAPTPEESRSKIVMILVVGLVLLGLTGIAGYYIATRGVTEPVETMPVIQQASPSPSSSASASAFPVVDSAQGMKTFTNTEAGYMISYPADKLIACASGSSPQDLLLWAQPFACPGPGEGHDALYFMDVRVEPDRTLAISNGNNPSKTEQVVVGGETVTQKTYQFTMDDGPLFSLGSMTKVIIPLKTEGNANIAITVLGDSAEDLALYQEVLSTFKFQN